MSKRANEQVAKLQDFALGLPEAWKDQPWEGDVVAKVGKKIFVFFGSDEYAQICVKLPESKDQALLVPGAEPSGYGLGKYGWVVVPVGKRGSPPLGVLQDWIEESYTAVAPKKLSAQLADRR